MGHGNCREEGLGVRMDGLFEELLCLCQFHDPPKVHDRHSIADVSDHPQIVGDEQVCNIELLPDLLHKIDDLCLNRYIQGRDRLVSHDQFRTKGQGPGNSRPLALSPENSWG